LPGGQQMPQPELERVLRDIVRRIPTVDLLSSTSASPMPSKNADSVVVELTEDGGRTVGVRTHWFVGAAGVRSRRAQGGRSASGENAR
jgi:2-polyprenyl-6-methoxyphenol hydroxylase-like FAD-dependent oxidoreductase